MPALTQRTPKHVLRSILRLLETPRLPDHLARKATAAAAASNNKHSKKPHNNASQAFLKQQYRRHALINCNINNGNNISDQQQRQAAAATLAHNYLQLQQDLAERTRLYELDTGAEQVLTAKEMSRRAAARAGLALPKLDPLLPEDDDQGQK